MIFPFFIESLEDDDASSTPRSLRLQVWLHFPGDKLLAIVFTFSNFVPFSLNFFSLHIYLCICCHLYVAS